MVRERLVPDATDAPGQRAEDRHRPRSPAAVAVARTREGHCCELDSNSNTPAAASAGTDSALIEAAAPAANPTHTTVPVAGRTRYRSANATASSEHAMAGPSAFTGPVTHSTDPLVVTKPAASTAGPREVR